METCREEDTARCGAAQSVDRLPITERQRDGFRFNGRSGAAPSRSATARSCAAMAFDIDQIIAFAGQERQTNVTRAFGRPVGICRNSLAVNTASTRIRTGDLLITNQARHIAVVQIKS